MASNGVGPSRLQSARLVAAIAELLGRWPHSHAMKTIITILWDTLAAAALLVAGFGLHSALGAPSWLLAMFTLPFLIYLHCRLEVSFRFILWFIVLFTVVSLAFALFVPTEYRIYSGGLVVVLLAPLSSRLRRPKPQTNHDDAA